MKYIFLSILMCISLELYAQEKSDTLKNSGNQPLLKDIKEYAQKDNFFSRLLKNIFVFEEEENGDNERHKVYAQYAGKIIRKINIKVLEVFGTSIKHPSMEAKSWLQKAGNSIHTNTREWLIRNKLLFGQGSKLYPYELSESERLLRQVNYIYDARITVQVPEQKNSDSVDVLVITQDVWSIKGGGNYQPGEKTGEVSVADLNFLGLGTELGGGVKINNGYSSGWDWDGNITVNNINRSYITAQIYRFADLNQRSYGVGINRDFFSPVTHWAGGIDLNHSENKVMLFTDKSIAMEKSTFTRQDFWLGYAFDVKTFDPNTINQNRFNVAGRIVRTKYDTDRIVDSMGLFQSNLLYLLRFGYSYRSYIQDRYIFGLGKTEDVPVGHGIELITGQELGRFRNMTYLGLKGGASSYDPGYGYAYAGAQVGAFNNKKWENGVVSAELLFFSRLLNLGSFRWRHFLWNRYAQTFNSPGGEEILDINNLNGLRGAALDNVRGSRKLVLNYESDFFLPLSFMDFKLAIINFADFALISPQNQSLFGSKLFQGYGIGFRIRNEHLIFPTIQVMFGFYPNLAQGRNVNVFKESSMFYHFNEFQFSKPAQVEF
ncbi:MAG: hypothetical protein ACM3RX_05540 [Methanococcaceae archaeon]